MPYRAPLKEYQFLLDHVVDYAQIAGTDRFCEASSDVVEAVLTEAGRLCEEVLDPLQRTATQIQRGWKMVSCAHHTALQKAIERSQMAAGYLHLLARNMAEWGCPSR